MKEIEKLLNDVVKGLREKSDFSGRWCKHYTEECAESLLQYAEAGKDCSNKCEYCTVDRAKHYEEKLNILWKEILASWEEDRNYWGF